MLQWVEPVPASRTHPSTSLTLTVYALARRDFLEEFYG